MHYATSLSAGKRTAGNFTLGNKTMTNLTEGPGFIYESVDTDFDRQLPCNTQSDITVTSSELAGYNFRSTKGEETPNFYRKLRAGKLLPINYFDQFEGSSSCSGTNHHEYLTQCKDSGWAIVVGDESFGSKVRFIENDIVPLGNEVASMTSSGIIDSVTQRASANLASATMDALTTAAELHKVARMFRNAGGSLVKLLTKYDPKTWADLWLEGRYGWRQLVFDFEALNDAIVAYDEKSSIYSSKAFDEDSGTLDSSRSVYFAEQKYRFNVVKELTYNISYRGLAYSKIKPGAFGLNPFRSAWELTPFSFVVDWFIGIGTAINHASGLVTHPDMLTGYGYLMTVHLHSYYNEGTVTENNPDPKFAWRVVEESGEANGEFVYTFRSAHSPPVTPQFNVHLSKANVIDILALVVQAWVKR